VLTWVWGVGRSEAWDLKQVWPPQSIGRSRPGDHNQCDKHKGVGWSVEDGLVFLEQKKGF